MLIYVLTSGSSWYMSRCKKSLFSSWTFFGAILVVNAKGKDFLVWIPIRHLISDYCVVFEILNFLMISFLTQSATQFIISFWIFQDFIWLSFGLSCKWSFRSRSISAKLFNIAWKLPPLLSSLSSLFTSLWPRSAKPCWAHRATACVIRFSTWTYLSYLFCYLRS